MVEKELQTSKEYQRYESLHFRFTETYTTIYEVKREDFDLNFFKARITTASYIIVHFYDKQRESGGGGVAVAVTNLR